MKRFLHTSQRTGFTLVEIMITVAILGVLLAIAGPTWMRQRTLSQQRSCQQNLSKMDGAKEQWALETMQPVGATPGWGDLVNADGTGYLKTQPDCPADGIYTINALGVDAVCTVVAPLDHNAKD